MKHILLYALAGGLLGLLGCGTEPSASRVTTTTNGIALVDSTRAPVPYARLILAKGWDSLAQKPSSPDTLLADSLGHVKIPSGTWALAWATDASMHMGAMQAQGLDTVTTMQLQPLQGAILAEQIANFPAPNNGLYLSIIPSLVQPHFNATLGWILDPIPRGNYQLVWTDSSHATLATSSFSTQTILPDTSARFWLADFEQMDIWPKYSTGKSTGAWLLYQKSSQVIRPATLDSVGFLSCLREDSTRQSRVFSALFDTVGDYFAVQSNPFPRVLTGKAQMCLSYRSNQRIKIEWFGDSADGYASPNFWIYVNASTTWKDTCVAFSAFNAFASNPASRSTWSQFYSTVDYVQILATVGAKYLEMDDLWVQ